MTVLHHYRHMRIAFACKQGEAHASIMVEDYPGREEIVE